MDKTRKFFNIAIGISIIVCSFSLLILSTRQNKVIAQTGTTLPNGVVIVGPALRGNSMNPDYYILGFNPKDQKVVVLGKTTYADMREFDGK